MHPAREIAGLGVWSRFNVLSHGSLLLGAFPEDLLGGTSVDVLAPEAPGAARFEQLDNLRDGRVLLMGRPPGGPRRMARSSKDVETGAGSPLPVSGEGAVPRAWASHGLVVWGRWLRGPATASGSPRSGPSDQREPLLDEPAGALAEGLARPGFSGPFGASSDGAVSVRSANRGPRRFRVRSAKRSPLPRVDGAAGAVRRRGSDDPRCRSSEETGCRARARWGWLGV